MGIEYKKTIIKEQCSKCGRDLSNDASATCPACGTARVSTDALRAQLDQKVHLMIDRVP